jgi:DNA-binding NarL/FixJ family response regulator
VKSLTVLIADDHPPTRAGIRSSLEGDGFVVCAEVADAPSAVEAAIRERPDLCLLDIHMPGNGISAAREISTRVPETAVVVLTVSRDDDDVFDALRAGASGYLLKDMDAARLPIALKGVLKGEAALPRRLVARLVDEFRERGRQRRVPILAERGALLTSREWEVLELMRAGLTTAQISDRLFISPATVRSHVAAILRKLGAPDRQAALRLLEDG